MKKGDRVKTKHGEGVIVDIENFDKSKRYGVNLDVKQFSFPIAYYFENEIEKI